MLRFRDLVTEPGGTIIEHRSIITSHNEVWWGWWMREQENPPRKFLADIMNKIQADTFTNGLLYDASRQKLYRCPIIDIKISPTRSGITSPEPEKSPEYYHRGRYPVWFLLKKIDEVDFESLDLFYDSVPSNKSENERYKSSKGKKIVSINDQNDKNEIGSLRDLRHIDATMWVLIENKM